MSGLGPIEIDMILDLFEGSRGKGYVLEFSDRTFSAFMREVAAVDIDDPPGNVQPLDSVRDDERHDRPEHPDTGVRQNDGFVGPLVRLGASREDRRKARRFADGTGRSRSFGLLDGDQASTLPLALDVASVGLRSPP